MKGLKPTAREAMLKIAAYLSGGFSGKLELECNDGGVHVVKVSKSIRLGKNKT